ncbi:FtsW/RodA/SpoVE family cell cycle protein [Priestia aryabhattai]|uniref:FtsW/RodA/SpoVE family cell cycle protein n=1 Tax=Priestia aryabhattai TaxID=412384 RepID=UPI003D2C4B75
MYPVDFYLKLDTDDYVNVGICIGLLPITGIPLPFISYGGSALMSTMFLMGLVLNISFRSKAYMFDQDVR